jgi:MoaA/NifB/PqqE/SkfB family radical SAM enzyme
MSYIDHLVPINNICNQKCNFCSAAERMEGNNEIPLKEIFSQILEKGNYIQISWGERLLHKKLYEILYFIRTRKPGTFIEFQTNAVLLLKNNNLDKLLRFHIDLFNVNYPCHIEEINDMIAQSKNTLKPREEAMRAILHKWAKLRINIIVTKMNYQYLPAMVEYFHMNFFWFDRIQMSFAKAMWAAKNNDSVVPTYEEASPFFIESLRIAESLWLTVDIDHIPMCFLGKYYKSHVDYHKLLNEEVGVFLEEKHFIGKCEGCDKRKLCSGYRKDYLNIYPYAQ